MQKINKDLEQLAKIYKLFFKEHNIFSLDNKSIIKYLKEESKKYPLLVYKENNDDIKGALFLVNFGQSKDGNHKLWKFRHFVFESRKNFEKLLKQAEELIKVQSATSKIELTISENEKGIKLYEKYGYKKEVVLENHYRFKEKCFIFGKSLKK